MRHAKPPVAVTTGYRVTMGVINTLFVISAVGMAVFLLGPVWYGLGL